jgi:hypothetical protein
MKRFCSSVVAAAFLAVVLVVLPAPAASASTTHTYTVDCLNTYAANGAKYYSVARGDTIQFRTLIAPGNSGVCDSLYYNAGAFGSTFSSLPGTMWAGDALNMNITVSSTAPLGGSYRFAVYTSTLSGGASNGTEFYFSITAATVTAPGSPGTPTATAGNGSATVDWPAPTTGGTPTGYTVTASPGGQTCTATPPTTSCEVTGLNNGTGYTFTVTANNSGGTSSASPSSNSVTPVAPLSPPGAPGTPTATAGNGSATVEWPAPTTGGDPATYTVTASPGGQTCTATAPAVTCEVTGLNNGTGYTFSVTANNSGGTSSASPSSNSVSPLALPGVPGQPTGTAGDGSAIISWDPPSSGGAPTSYTVTSSPGGLTCTAIAPATTCEITGLTNGVFYTFSVRAANASGNSTSSSDSTEVLPEAASDGSGGESSSNNLLALTGPGGNSASTLSILGALLVAAGAFFMTIARRRGNASAVTR